MTEKLERCPFCGNDHVIWEDNPHGYQIGNGWTPWCTICGANIFSGFKGKEKPAAAWNHRTPPEWAVGLARAWVRLEDVIEWCSCELCEAAYKEADAAYRALPASVRKMVEGD